jgi:transcriptional regulator with XRE-family HTH domain
MPERLRLILDHFSLTQSGLAERIGMTHSIISQWLNESKAMPQSTAMAFQTALGVRWQWLLTGDGEMLLPDIGKLSEEEVRLLSAFRQSDIEARAAILEQAEFQLGRADRRRERK